MHPTVELRFIRREVTIPITDDIGRAETRFILQQKWSGCSDVFPQSLTGDLAPTMVEEWRDVPTVDEEKT